ncbi:MAG: cytochrome P450 [Janthinobacterium lividum]
MQENTPSPFSTAPGLPVLGSLIPLSRNALRLFTRLAVEHGDRVRLRVPGRQILLLSHPQDLEMILVRDKAHYGRSRELRKLRPVFGNGLVVSDGELWRRQRNMVQPHFQHDALARYAEIMLLTIRPQLQRWCVGETRDMLSDMLEYTGNTICEVLFGKSFQVNHPGVGAAVRTVFGDLRSEILYLPVWRRLPLGKGRRWNSAAQTLNRAIRQTIAARRASDELHEDLLQALLMARDEQGRPMSDQQLHDEIMTFFIGGYETAALALTWCTYLLAQHQEVQNRVRQELHTVLNGRSLQASDLSQLRYTQAVIKETLRLYPPAWSIGRCSLPGAVLGGEALPAGTDIWINLHGLHHDARWYQDPESFRPERWIGHVQTPYTFLPFGIGPRVCIGQHFAMAEATLALAAMLSKFRLTRATPESIEPSAWLTLRPSRPVLLRITEA